MEAMLNQKVMRSQGMFTGQQSLHCYGEVGTLRAEDKHRLLAEASGIVPADKGSYQSVTGKKRQRGFPTHQADPGRRRRSPSRKRIYPCGSKTPTEAGGSPWLPNRVTTSHLKLGINILATTPA